MAEQGVPGGSTLSLWQATVTLPTFPALNSDIECDVVIVGAGLAGISTAYFLAKAGKRVVLLDDGGIASGETSRTTAHLTNEIDDRYYQIVKWHGEDGARIAADSQTRAIDQIEKNVRDLSIDCDFERLDGYLYLYPTETSKELDDEQPAAAKAGIQVERVVSLPPSILRTASALRFPRQAQYHPLKYLKGLVEEIVKLGGKIYCNSHVESFVGPNANRKGEHVELKTSEGHTVRATYGVIATNTPVNDWVVMHTKQAAYRTYVIGLEVERGSFSKGLYWDTLEPYHYIRVWSDLTDTSRKDVIIIGGEDHKTGQKDSDDRDASSSRFRALEDWARDHIGVKYEVAYRWSGQVMEPVDGLAFFGRNPMDASRTFIITGDSGMGMTNCTAGAMLVSDAILGKENPWTELYDPKRKTLRSAGTFLEENLNVAAQYADYLKGGDAPSEDAIPRGIGAIISHGLDKHAVYRDDTGKLHSLSAKCTHLGCIVHFNKIEKSWDCPCHGSRFTIDGKVINGPAIKGLSKVPDK